MYYAMQLTEGVATRIGRMTPKESTAIKIAQRRVAAGKVAYVEQYGVGVIWTPNASTKPN
jgi:hypothetical protein